ncbi:chaplin [Streptomyces hoynatensis]|uniref:Chaplin n=1 Tax=Streptomyces hoynatensis TaxID=1141874 RepID=A0A3A9ZGP9_9ACTN|nr:chaplin [Streptomyces hoynatensis]RKN47215.1 chaplin [Streptomyces hoynatensis]
MKTTSKLIRAAGLGVLAASVCAAPAWAGDKHEGKPGGCVNLGDANAGALAAGSPGLISGNVIQIPVSVPINLCGNSLNLVGIGNFTAGN